jgi:aryl-alcohol dehydrogenase-like predicted oxidoreductase
MTHATALIPFGHTGLAVTRVGFGAMHFDGIEDESAVGALLNGVIDSGINLVDTARGYGRSEARIGRHLAHRRHEFVLSTKFGYGVDGVADWTFDCVRLGVDRALQSMRTDWIDIGHLHSCPLHILERGEVQQALADAVKAGKLRVAAYSGENAELAHALADSRLGSVQCSVSLTDQANLSQLQTAQGQGVLVKRALSGLAWARPTRPNGDGERCEGQYFDRWQAMQLPNALGPLDMPWAEVSLRFAAHQTGVSSVLIGTKNLANLQSAVDAVNRGPLPLAIQTAIKNQWSQAGGAHWPGIV